MLGLAGWCGDVELLAVAGYLVAGEVGGGVVVPAEEHHFVEVGLALVRGPVGDVVCVAPVGWPVTAGPSAVLISHN